MSTKRVDGQALLTTLATMDDCWCYTLTVRFHSKNWQLLVCVLTTPGADSWLMTVNCWSHSPSTFVYSIWVIWYKGVNLTGLLGGGHKRRLGVKSPSGVQKLKLFLWNYTIFALKYNKQQLLLLLDKITSKQLGGHHRGRPPFINIGGDISPLSHRDWRP